MLMICVNTQVSIILFVTLDELFFFFKKMTTYEMRISDWSSDVCSSDLLIACGSKSLGSRFRGNDGSLCFRGNGLLCSRGDYEPSRFRANGDHQDRAAWSD